MADAVRAYFTGSAYAGPKITEASEAARLQATLKGPEKIPVEYRLTAFMSRAQNRAIFSTALKILPLVPAARAEEFLQAVEKQLDAVVASAKKKTPDYLYPPFDFMNTDYRKMELNELALRFVYPLAFKRSFDGYLFTGRDNFDQWGRAALEAYFKPQRMEKEGVEYGGFDNFAPVTAERRRAFRRLVAAGELPVGLWTETDFGDNKQKLSTSVKEADGYQESNGEVLFLYRGLDMPFLKSSSPEELAQKLAEQYQELNEAVHLSRGIAGWTGKKLSLREAVTEFTGRNAWTIMNAVYKHRVNEESGPANPLIAVSS
ncbi:MAG: hypothetical protein HY714_06540, partial [Candidatus Omnitrophica bacterium]|nr:hypothetical protein [Candidatus Omnitrophota bacterium]